MYYKKYFLFSAMILAGIFAAHSQTIFNQNGEIIKLYGQQIALLQTYSIALKEGYKIVEGGIQTTKDLKNGEFNLHNIYYSSLETVNPQIKNYPFAMRAIDLYSRMAKARSGTYAQINGSVFFSANETTYARIVYKNLMDAADEDMKELQEVTTDGEMKMTDDERIKRINAIYKRMQQKFKTMVDFDRQILMILNGRKQQQEKSMLLKKLYDSK